MAAIKLITPVSDPKSAIKMPSFQPLNYRLKV